MTVRSYVVTLKPPIFVAAAYCSVRRRRTFGVRPRASGGNVYSTSSQRDPIIGSPQMAAAVTCENSGSRSVASCTAQAITISWSCHDNSLYAAVAYALRRNLSRCGEPVSAPIPNAASRTAGTEATRARMRWTCRVRSRRWIRCGAWLCAMSGRAVIPQKRGMSTQPVTNIHNQIERTRNHSTGHEIGPVRGGI